MNVNIHQSWKTYLQAEFDKPYFKDLASFVKKDYHQHTCYPSGNQIFNAFEHCHFDDVKVVIIGQDPYHGKGQAHGLCFSVNDGIVHPPSLKNIFKEIENDLGILYPLSGNLNRWADQGVLLLNTALTVEDGQPASHAGKGWETVTDALIQTVAKDPNPRVFMLWGAHAQTKQDLLASQPQHLILTCNHPSPLSARRGANPFIGCGHFKTANAWLLQQNLQVIDWKA